MYESHPILIQPDNEDIKVWRYIDFTKLVSLIDTRSLYFARADKFNDPFEGSWPKINVEARNYPPIDLPEESKQQFLEAMKDMDKFNKNWTKQIAINCWHENANESAAMWKLYLKSDEGIAIQSTYKRLKTSIIDDEKIFIGKVNYIDYENDYIDAGNLLNPFFYKRKSFEHEREIRALLVKWPTGGTRDFPEGMINNGLSIKVDLEILINNIFIAPNAPKWFTHLVEALIKKYGYEFNVAQSQMNNSPLF